MNRLLNWAGNILFFLIFLTVLENLLPNRKYSRYIRFFAGLVLILLVVQPVAEGLDLEEKLTGAFKEITFRQQAEDLSREIMGIEQQRLQQIMGSYEKSVESDLNVMAQEMGYQSTKTHVVIEKDGNSKNYGSIVKIEMEVMKEDEETGQNYENAVQAVNPVEPVTVHLAEKDETAESLELKGQKTGIISGLTGQEETRQLQGEGALDQLRRKVESYYGLETGKVEIKFQRQ